jgi:hypothetical protein
VRSNILSMVLCVSFASNLIVLFLIYSFTERNRYEFHMDKDATMGFKLNKDNGNLQFCYRGGTTKKGSEQIEWKVHCTTDEQKKN